MKKIFHDLVKPVRTRLEERQRAKLVLSVLNIVFTLLAVLFTYIVCQALRQLLEHAPHR